MISLGDSLVSEVQCHLKNEIHVDKLLIDDNLSDAVQEPADDTCVPAEEAQELEELRIRSAELEDLCLDLEGQRSFIERQVMAAKALIRRKVAGAQLPLAGCPLCEHCQALSIS